MSKGSGEGSKATQFKPLSLDLETRFHASYIPEPNSGCWLWEQGVDNKGYGRITISKTGKMHLAHRISYFIHKGRTEKFVLHHCDMPCCVNPDHLYAGTQLDNMRDRERRNRVDRSCGEDSHNPKITTADMLAIRNDARSQRVIAKQYGISQGQVSNIKLRKQWKHIP